MKIISNCKRATFLIEKKQIGGITMRYEMALQLHLACCSLCRVYEQQSIMIDQLVHELQFMQTKQLDDDLKKEMQKLITVSLEKIK
ncbi:hypothetical protein [Mucilaginibacter agri]|uniref:Zf-HC2 domain-containing protein n=1 Tax=Mucilaginibacter agri TaxID=2695265 RepID=A0A966DTY7_9SPHI|nr:hypothetical protein [Mucilaginibacter agri]NCD69144.1 hypothetical protein [Mucilaginibacter agri]